MLAMLSTAFEEEGWMYEIKWDGYRAISMMQEDQVNLMSRNKQSFNRSHYPVFLALQEWGLHAIVDGEIVVLDHTGKPNFGALQNWKSEADGDLVYYVFDLLWMDGYDFTGVPLVERRKWLEKQIPDNHSIIRMSESFDASAMTLLKEVDKMGLEGIMAKKEDSLYHPGIRTKEWLKMKTVNRHEVVIGGFTQSKGDVHTFRSLLVGWYANGKLLYKGKVGSGFSVRVQKEIMQKLKPLIRKSNPFAPMSVKESSSRWRSPPSDIKITWVKPVLVGEVTYTELTADGIMRHPAFKGLRGDKKASEVREEKILSITHNHKPNRLKKMKVDHPMKPAKSFLDPEEEDQIKNVNRKALKFTNLDKVFWTKEKIVKRDLIQYYHEVAPYMLPHLMGRPHTLNRHPDGFAGKSFFQKDVTGKVPDWMELFPYRTEDEDVDKNFLVVREEASLLVMANMGCIEINPWNSTVAKPDHPTWCVIDLDPDTNTFDTVIRIAQVGHDLLSGAGIESYCKTSGSTGLHIYIPLHAKYTYDQSKEFARFIVTILQKEMPRVTSIERSVSKRKGKVYLDFLQNRPQATLAAVYSVRPKPGAPVSMPLEWDEVKKGLHVTDYTLKNVLPILKERGDIFKNVLGKGIDMKTAIKNLESLRHG